LVQGWTHRVVSSSGSGYVDLELATPRRIRAQICGEVVLEIDGRRVERDLPGGQGRLLFVYLTSNRLRSIGREELVAALWEDRPPAGPDGALRVLLSKLRRVLGPEVLPTGGEVQLRFPRDTRVDLEAARDAIHRAESALALGEWERAWGASQVSLFTARRGFLPGEEREWIEERRRELDELYLRSLECYAKASLEIGGTELAAAERCGREMVARSPYRESGYRLLMLALAHEGNSAEALQVYERLRGLLRAELGIVPSAGMRELHASLLEAGAERRRPTLPSPDAGSRTAK
jgi:DNA-binding SARP family transcriptional activator